MTNNINIFVLWANGRHKEAEILSDIKEHFEILQTYEIFWNSKYFTRNLSRFYGKKLPNAFRKKKLCGTGAFLVICVNDPKPHIQDNKNLNLTAAKHRYRQMLGGNYIHASDTKQEAEENLLLLTGLAPSDLPQTTLDQAQQPIVLHQDLIGTPAWKSETQLLSFMAKIPQIKFRAPNIIESQNITQTARLLNARKKLFSLNRERYLIKVNHKNCEFLLKEAA